jgi:hypothetical protein
MIGQYRGLGQHESGRHEILIAWFLRIAPGILPGAKLTSRAMGASFGSPLVVRQSGEVR